MPRIDVPFVVEKQRITQPTQVELVAGGQNYFYATFELCDTWSDLSDIKVMFSRDDITKLVELTDGGGTLECQIPWEVMVDKGVFHVGIFGGLRLLTDLTYVKVRQGCLTEGEPPTPSGEDWFGKVEREISELESGKANKSDVYTKVETNNVVKQKINTALNDYYTKTEVKEYVDGQTEIIKSDVEGIQERINKEAHFRGYLMTDAGIQEMPATPNDFAYSAESGTVWVYDAKTGWQDTGTPVPDKGTPLSNATPLINGVASSGQSEEGARSDHRHPTDTTRLGVAEFNAFKSELDAGLDNIIAKQNALIGGGA